MRLFRSIEEKHGVEQPGYEPPGDTPALTTRIAAAERSAAARPPAPSLAQTRDATVAKLTHTKDAIIEHANARVINPVGAILTSAGAVAILVASFLPIYEVTSTLGILVHLPRNTFIQQQEWLIPIVGALLLTAALNALIRGRRRDGWWMLTVAVTGAAIVAYDIYAAQQKVSHAHGGYLALGIGVYAVGVGAALALFGALERTRSIS